MRPSCGKRRGSPVCDCTSFRTGGGHFNPEITRSRESWAGWQCERGKCTTIRWQRRKGRKTRRGLLKEMGLCLLMPCRKSWRSDCFLKWIVRVPTITFVHDEQPGSTLCVCVCVSGCQWVCVCPCSSHASGKISRTFPAFFFLSELMRSWRRRSLNL